MSADRAHLHHTPAAARADHAGKTPQRQPVGRGVRTTSPWFKRARVALSGPWWRELLLAAALYGLYDLIRGAIVSSTTTAMRDGQDLLAWEQSLHLDPEHTLNRVLDAIPAVAVPACYFYATLHFLITPAVLIWTYRHRPADYRRDRNVLAVITFVALLGFWLFPTAPPRLLHGAGFHDTLALFSNWGWWGSTTSLPGPAAAIANQYAAMPSLHLAWAMWCGATVWRHNRRRGLRILAVAYPLLTALVVLGTANHYTLDVLAGAALWAFAQLTISVATAALPVSTRSDFG